MGVWGFPLNVAPLPIGHELISSQGRSKQQHGILCPSRLTLDWIGDPRINPRMLMVNRLRDIVILPARRTATVLRYSDPNTIRADNSQ